MLPFFFTALKVGTTLAFIGAIVASTSAARRGPRPGRRAELEQRLQLRRGVGGDPARRDRGHRVLPARRRRRAARRFRGTPSLRGEEPLSGIDGPMGSTPTRPRYGGALRDAPDGASPGGAGVPPAAIGSEVQRDEVASNGPVAAAIAMGAVAPARPCRRRRAAASGRPLEAVSCSCSGRRRRSSPATSPPTGAGLLRGRGTRRRHSRPAARRRPAAGRLGARRARVHDRWVPKVLQAREGQIRPRRHRPDLPALGHPVGRRGRHAASPRPRTTRARRSASGTSATSSRSSPPPEHRASSRARTTRRSSRPST